MKFSKMIYVQKFKALLSALLQSYLIRLTVFESCQCSSFENQIKLVQRPLSAVLKRRKRVNQIDNRLKPSVRLIENFTQLKLFE